jgi:lipid A 3-O-deacylase
MHTKGVVLATGFTFLTCLVSAQAVDNVASFRIIDAARYVRLHYENDYFTGTDLYYTQGINLEIVNPSYKKFPLSKLLLTSANAINQYGISIEHNGYTPSSISSDNILYGDRPFAAAVMLKNFAMSAHPDKRYRITSSFSLGVVGSVASGYWMQKTIHRWLHGRTPHGWQYQIANDAIINYEAGIEKNLLHAGDYLIVNGLANAHVGTYSDKLSVGAVFMFGKLNSALTSVFCGADAVHKKFSFHLYFQPLLNMVGYDATMQGGFFNRDSPYTLSFEQINHFTIQGNYGAVLSYHSVYLEYFKTALSREFESGINHRWGGVRIGVAF